MKKSKMTWSRALIGSAIVLALLLTGCPGGDDPEPGTSGDETQTIAGGDLAALFPAFVAPETGATPVTAFGTADSGAYTGAIVWKNGTNDHSGPFEGGQTYTAVVTLTANAGYSFTGYTGAFTHGTLTGTASGNIGTALTVTFTFTETTAGQNDPDPVTDTDLSAKFDAPVRDAEPNTEFGADTDEYTGTIVWKYGLSFESTLDGNFAASTVYQAVVTLNANDGHTFTGAAPVTYGALTVTGATGSGTTLEVTIEFGETDPADGAEPTPIAAGALDSFFDAPAVEGTPVRLSATDDPIVGANYKATSIAWEVDGTAFDGEKFEAGTVYTAVVTLATLTAGRTFTGFTGNFTHGEVTGTPSENEGATLTVSFAFAELSDTPAEDEKVIAFTLTGKFAAPSVGGSAASPAFTKGENAQYDGAVAWKSVTGGTESDFSSDFVVGGVYKAVVILTAEEGYTFTDVTGPFVFINGEVTLGANTGTTLVVNIAFAALADPSTLTAVADFDLSTKITAPAYGVASSTVFTEGTTPQYGGTVKWYEGDSTTEFNTNFGAKVYKAVVTLIAKDGKTFSEVAATSFSHGSVIGTGSTGTGTTLEVTLTFPELTAPPVTDGSLGLSAGFDYTDIPVTVTLGETELNTAALVLYQDSEETVTFAVTGYADVKWHVLNNAGIPAVVEDAQGDPVHEYTPDVSTLAVKKHTVTVTAQKGGHTYSRAVTFSVKESAEP
jgi:hypothetical protein